MYSIGELRPGMAIIVDNDPFFIISAQHSKQARAGGVVRTKIRNMLSGAIINRTFQGNDKLEPADVSYSQGQFLYKDGEGFHFMDNTSFEQFSFDEEAIDEQANFLVDGLEVDILNYNGNPIGLRLPPKVVLKVIDGEPGVKGDTASGGTKPVTCETGFKVNVPLFVNIGDSIRINTESGAYVERA